MSWEDPCLGTGSSVDVEGPGLCLVCLGCWGVGFSVPLGGLQFSSKSSPKDVFFFCLPLILGVLGSFPSSSSFSLFLLLGGMLIFCRLPKETEENPDNKHLLKFQTLTKDGCHCCEGKASFSPSGVIYWRVLLRGGHFHEDWRDVTPICHNCCNLYLFMLFAIILVFIHIYW